jgi:hypothetical protein
MSKRPNFYVLLELSPLEDDWSAIEQQIREKKIVWARDSTMGNPKKRREARLNMELLQDINRVLSDPMLRQQEAEDALRHRDEFREIQEDDLAGWIGLLKESGACSPEQFEKLSRRFKDTFSEQELTDQLRAAGIRTGHILNDAGPVLERTDHVTVAALRQRLEVLNIANLYEFLDLPPSAPVEDLRSQADAIYKKNQRLGRTDAETTTRNELAGFAKAIFRGEEERRRYDAHLLFEAMEALKPRIDLAGAPGFISEPTFESLVRMACKRGVPEFHAQRLIRTYAGAQGWKINAAPAPALLQGAINNVTSKSFGIVIYDNHNRELVVNIIIKDDPVPCTRSMKIDTQEEALQSMEIYCMENVSREPRVDISSCRKLGKVVLAFGKPLPKGSKVEVIFQLGPDGLLNVNGKDLITGRGVATSFQTDSVMSPNHLEMARERNMGMSVSIPRGNIKKDILPTRDRVFVSYSHKDRKWLERLRTKLAPHLRVNQITVWEDTQISSGERWQQKIEEALAAAKVAVLLVSDNFLASEFIVEKELHPLLKAAKEDSLTVIWVYINNCAWNLTDIRYIQAAHDISRPLNSLPYPKCDKILYQISERIMAAMGVPAS